MKHNTQSGFSLLELSIVLTILSILVGTIITLVPIQQTQQAAHDLDNKFDKIQIAIDNYTGQYGRLPCPAAKNLANDTVNFGVETDCSAANVNGTIEIAGNTSNENLRSGVLPTRTLNLPDNFMFDSLNNRIDYTVVKNLAITSNAFNSYQTSQNDTILMTNIAANRINQANTAQVANFVAYVFLSHGQNSSGATNYDGSYIHPCPTTGADSGNCDNNNTFIDDSFNSNQITYYDDVVRWKTYQSLIRDSGLSPKINALLGTIGFRKFALFTYTLILGNEGNSLAVTWNVRKLNTQKYNTLDSATLANNAVTLGQGTYIIRAKAVAYKVDAHKIRLYDVTNNQTIAIGIANMTDSTSASAVQTEATVEAYLEINANTTYRIDHYTQTATINGLGVGTVSNIDPSCDFVQMEIFSK